MMNIEYILLTTSIAICVASCSIKDGMDDCPQPQDKSIVLKFECIEIYNKSDIIIFDKVTDELELLFYDTHGVLIYDLGYTAAELAEKDWEVVMEEDKIMPGYYTLLALVNYNNEHYTLTGKEKLETLLAGLKYGTGRTEDDYTSEINFPLTDTYYGYYELELDYEASTRTHKVMLSKNTNFVNLTVVCRSEADYNSITAFESRMIGNNTLYDWANTAIDKPAVSYIPYWSVYSDLNRTYTDWNKTMRIWHASDLRLEINFTAAGEQHREIFDIPAWMSTIDDYDTDDKLEHYDEFDIKITYGESFVVVAVTVNGWYVVKNDEDI